MINLYPSPAAEGARAAYNLRSVPGTRSFLTLPGPFFRAMKTVEGTLYAICRGVLYQVTSGGSAVQIASVADDPNTTMAGHRSSVTIAADGTYYRWSGAALTTPGSGRISNVGSVTFSDQYTILSERDGREVEWTEAGQPGSRNALYFATTEGRDDNNIRAVSSGAYVWMLKQKSTEIWANAGATTLAFQRIPGGVIDTGLLGFNLVCNLPVGLFFVGHDKVAYITEGAGLRPVSTPNVDQALSEETPTHCFYYEDRGHRFCVIRFANRPAWVYDVSMGLWHERSTGASHQAWAVIAAEYAYGQWHLATQNGAIYRLGTAPVDADGTMRRTVVSQPLYPDGDRFSVNLLEFMGNFGAGSVTETGPNWLTDELGFPLQHEDGSYMLAENQLEVQTIERPARMWIRVSRDGGRTWGNPKHRDIGKLGQYQATCRFRAMGQFRQMTVEANMTDPVDVLLLSEANVS